MCDAVRGYRRTVSIVLVAAALCGGAGAADHSETPILGTVEVALAYIADADVTDGLELYIADELWKDPPGTQVTGVRISVVVNAVFRRGLVPGDPAVQKDGYRIYKFVPRSKFVPPP